MSRQCWLLFVPLALLIAFAMTHGVVAQPGFTDAFYHFNAANRLVSGQGLTAPYLWHYINAPDALPAPSHTYWMPFTSLTAAAGMWLFNAPGNYAAAQTPFALMLAGTACVGFWLGGRAGGTARHAWLAGLLTLFSGFYVRFWGATDTFAPYAFVGSLALVGLSLLPLRQGVRGILFPPLLTGAFSALAHLTRADGILLLLVGYMVIFYPFGWIIGKRDDERTRYTVSLRLQQAFVMTLAYLLVMLPWFLRNLEATGAPLPIGGAQAMWFTSYDDIFSYPPDASAANFFAENGVQRLIETRWLALTNNLGTFIAVEGWVALAPFMLIGLWRRRRDPFWRGFWLYALGAHLAMTFVFPFPGYRGGLFHSAAALIPFWAALGLLGLDAAVEWAAKRRRWRADTAKAVFSAAVFGFALYLSISTALNGRVGTGTPLKYAALAGSLPVSARVMVNDPAALYYFTGLGGVALPNEAPDVIPDIARRYAITHLLLEAPDGTPRPLWSLFETTPAFLREVPFDVPGVRLFEISAESVESAGSG